MSNKAELENYYLNNYGVTQEDYQALFEDYKAVAKDNPHVREHFGTIEQRFQKYLLGQKETAESSTRSKTFLLDKTYAEAYNNALKYRVEAYDTGMSSSWKEALEKSRRNKYQWVE